MEYRTLSVDEAEQFWSLMNQLDYETKYMLYEPGERTKNLSEIESIIRDSVEGHDFLLVAETDNKLIGYISAQKGRMNRIAHSAYIVVGILTDYRGKGIGTKFFKRLNVWAEENNVVRLELTVICENEAAKHLYTNSDFEIEGMKRKSTSNNRKSSKFKKVTYVKSSGEYKESYQSASFMKKMYDKSIYDIVLLTLKTVFDSSNSNMESIVLNGKVNTIDKSTGKSISPYILSVNVSKDKFAELNLDYIDSKEWFKSSRGVSASTFTKMTPVAPVVEMSKEDHRFIEGYEVADRLDESVNLAAIDWQDFENLIREVFAEEFNSNGGEVKITQASRDGGVDAVAFDPDPIRGGKIVIQAKRYTNVVGVSAVRDLYGTVMNEGATKGILVTTSNYGNDAYEFAKGKPLTLMNGANLLYLLEKHGHKAKIDLQEAKELNSQNQN
ncbi:GNAT family N-acetyltransferase [Blautia obeum]|uniref:GNAT family N-acetyltransferase n=1 Tax=Blautia obeum TaxID=40520 RepID=UPI003F8C2D7F